MGETKVIKRPATLSRSILTRGVVKRPIVEARHEARRIMSEADEYAERARRQADELARQMREQAYAEGYEKGLAELNTHIFSARQTRERVLLETETDLVRLAVKMAEKIIGRELKQSPSTSADIVATALRHARRSDVITIRINPADFPAVDAARAQLDQAGRAQFLDIVADKQVSAGGCLIESDSGTIDAQLETQLRVLERALLSNVEEPPTA
jgi:type III secretion protein L